MRACSGAFLLALLVCLAGGATAAVYRLRPGDDFAKAAAKLRPGDTLKVSPGLYTKGWWIAGVYGTVTQPIVIRGEGRPVLRPKDTRDAIEFPFSKGSAYVVVEGLTIEGGRRAGIIVGRSRHVTIRDCVIRSNTVWGVQTVLSDFITVEKCRVYGSRREHGIYFSTTDHPVVRDCEVFGNAACGIHMNGDHSEGGDGLISEAVVERNVIHGNGRRGGAAVNMDGVERSVVRDNLLFGNTSGGIVSFVENGISAGKGNRIEQNTVLFDPDRGRFGISFVGGSRGTTIRRNLVVSGKAPVVLTDVNSLRGLVSDGNVFWSSASEPPFAVGDERLGLADWRARTSQDGSSVLVDPRVTVTSNHTYVVNGAVPPAGRRAGALTRCGEVPKAAGR